MRLGLSLLLAALACAGWVTPGSAADLKERLHTVAVVSAMGDTVYFQPGNSSLFIAGQMPSRVLAGLDGEIERVAKQTLSTDAPGITFVPVETPHDALLAAAARVYRTDEGAINAVRTALQPWRDKHAVDVIVVLLPMQSSLVSHAQPRLFYDMGVSWDEGVVLMQAVVVDGKTGAVIGSAKTKAIAPLGFAVTSETFLDPAPAAKTRLTNYFTGLLDSATPALLRDAGL